ncbi:hypothetical protein D3C84_1315410 [compost metagenome]
MKVGQVLDRVHIRAVGHFLELAFPDRVAGDVHDLHFADIGGAPACRGGGGIG